MTDASMAAMTLSGAAVAGIVCQSVARTLQIPGIVLLLAFGVVLGPDLANVIRPDSLGDALPEVVGFAVAVILFEGGMHLKLSRFAEQEKPIRRLVTFGAVLTALGGTLAARLIMQWDWRLSALFGCLVIVTGPTVVTPLLRRFKLVPAVSDVLEAEGVLIDAVGAVVAVVALEVALEPSQENLARGAVGIAVRLGLGSLLGLVVGFLISALLRNPGLVGEGLENVFTLAIVWALFKASEALVHESGVAAVTMAGLVMGSQKIKRHERLLDFNDQLTVLLIGTLFILLAANVRIDTVLALGWPGVATVAALILVVRPVNVALSTRGSSLSTKERFFIAWIGPRGIIAAAVASLFATTLAARGIEGGAQIKALVFLVISITVVVAGLTGGPVAKLLKLSRQPNGWLFLGADGLPSALAKILVGAGERVTLVDRSVDHCIRAREEGLKAVEANGLDDDTLQKVHVERYAGAAGVTPSDETNLLFIQKVRRAGKVNQLFAALRSVTVGASVTDVHQARGALLFGDEYDIDRWNTLFREGEASIEVMTSGSETKLNHDVEGARYAIPLALHRGDEVRPIADDIDLKTGDRVCFGIADAHRKEGIVWLHSRGWVSGDDEDDDDA